MQPKSINGKALMMSSVALNASKTSKILSLFHLILKIFTLQLLRSSYQNETKIQITEDDKKIIYHSTKFLLFDQGNTWMKKGGV